MPPMACMPPPASPAAPEGRPASNSAWVRLPSPSASSWLNTSSLLAPAWLAVPPDIASRQVCSAGLAADAGFFGHIVQKALQFGVTHAAVAVGIDFGQQPLRRGRRA